MHNDNFITYILHNIEIISKVHKTHAFVSHLLPQTRIQRITQQIQTPHSVSSGRRRSGTKDLVRS